MGATIGKGRWYVKKGARTAVALGTSLGLSSWTPRRTRHPAVRVLTYHRFGASSRDPFCVNRDELESHLSFLSERGLAISLADFVEFLDGRRTLSPNAVLLTIDDGARSVATEALPIFTKYRVPAVAFVTVSGIGTRELLPEGEPYMSWEELAMLSANGIEVASHGWTHRSFGQLTEDEVREEGTRSKRTLEEKLQKPVNSLAYPFGTRSDYSASTERVLHECGYEYVFTSQHGAVTQDLSPTALPRVKVEGGDPALLFPLLCRGAMDSWRYVDRSLYLLQRAGR